MYLPDTPSKPAESLSDSDILGLFKAWGRCGKVAIRRALALLPEIIRRGLYRKHFASPFEFAIKTLGVTQDVVERVLRLHGQIGHMPELWSLLSSGEEGWSKLEIVAGLATPDTAAWWAEHVRNCSAAELRELVRRFKAQHAARQDAIGDSAEENAMLPLGFPGPGEAGPAEPAPAEPARRATSCSSTSARDRQSSEVNNSRNADGSPHQAPAPEASAPEASAPEGSAPEGSASEAPASEAAAPEAPHLEAPPTVSEFAGKTRPVTIYLTSEDEDLLRAWQASLRRAQGIALSLGEVVGRLLRGELRHQEPGAPALERQGASEGDRSPSDGGQNASDGERPSVNWSASDGERPGSDVDREADGGDRPGAARAGSAAAAPRRAPANLADLAPKRVEVLIRPVGVPGNWAGKLMGVLPTGIAAAFRPHETIVLEDLFLDAVEVARRHKGDRIPFAVRKFVALRAGFRCETGGCQSPIHDLDHDKPRAEGGDHHPDNVHARCVRHHSMRHKALFADIAAGVVIGPGSPDLSSPADRAFQSAQARAVATGL